MIIKKNMSRLQMLIYFRGGGISAIWWRLSIFTVFSVVITTLEIHFHVEQYSLTPVPFTLLGATLGIFLAFRNNSAYDRFWEARKLWGALVNTSRSFARQSFSFIDNRALNEDAAESTKAADGQAELDLYRFREEMVTKAVAFTRALRHRLRDSNPIDDLVQYIPANELDRLSTHRNIPTAILHDMGQRLAEIRRRGWIHPWHAPVLEKSLVDFTDILGGCERIKNTPIPFCYTVLTHQIVTFYCFLLPFGLIKTVGILTPFVAFLISYAFLGLDAIGDELEQPFGLELNDLPLQSLCTTIEIDLLQSLGRDDLPETPLPTNDVLS